MKYVIIGVSAAILAGCTGPVNDQTTQEMPTGFLCRMLDSNEYLTLPSEQMAIYRELDRRGESCDEADIRISVK